MPGQTFLESERLAFPPYIKVLLPWHVRGKDAEAVQGIVLWTYVHRDCTFYMNSLP